MKRSYSSQWMNYLSDASPTTVQAPLYSSYIISLASVGLLECQVCLCFSIEAFFAETARIQGLLRGSAWRGKICLLLQASVIDINGRVLVLLIVLQCGAVVSMLPHEPLRCAWRVPGASDKWKQVRDSIFEPMNQIQLVQTNQRSSGIKKGGFWTSWLPFWEGCRAKSFKPLPRYHHTERNQTSNHHRTRPRAVWSKKKETIAFK